jgi:hypothetical protein
VTTPVRTRWARAVVLIALTSGMAAVSATPSMAAPAPIRILSVSAENVEPGDTVRVKFRVTNTGSATEAAIVVVGGGLKCATGCRAEPSLKAGQSKNLEATVVAPAASPGEISGLNISVAVRLGGQNSYDFTMVYVHGSGASSPGTSAPAAEKVDGVSGRVRDADGKAVSGVALTIRDSAGHEYRATSDRSGRFSIKGTAAEPIAEGTITVVAARDGYRTERTTVRGRAGATATVRVTLEAVAAPTTTTPSPDSSPTVDDEASEPVTKIVAAQPPDLETVSDEGVSPVFPMLGGLLVVAGLGVLALMVIRRRGAGAGHHEIG